MANKTAEELNAEREEKARKKSEERSKAAAKVARKNKKGKGADWCGYCDAPARPTLDGKHKCQCRHEKT